MGVHWDKVMGGGGAGGGGRWGAVVLFSGK